MTRPRYLLLVGIGVVLATAMPAGPAWSQDESGPTADRLVFPAAQTSFIRNAFIASPIAGVVARVQVREGDAVDAGTTLAALQWELAEKELIAARAALDAAQIESDNDVNRRYAQRTLEVRQHEMQQSQLANRTYDGAVSGMELREIKLKVDQATLAIEQADRELMIAAAAAVEKQAAVDIARVKLDRHTIATNVAGIVAEVAVEAGEWVDAGKPIVRIVALDPIRVECFVDARKHGRELVGRNVKFIPTGSTADEALAGEITFVSLETNPVTEQVRIYASLKNPQGKIGSGVSGSLIVQ